MICELVYDVPLGNDYLSNVWADVWLAPTRVYCTVSLKLRECEMLLTESATVTVMF
ncbi:hypothetical protein HDF11_003327 [Tunturiibacter psychrotolerans]